MAIFGTLAPFVRNISVSSGELALYRALMASVIVGAYLAVSPRRKNDFSERPDSEGASSDGKKNIILLFLSGMAMGINWILLFEAYKYTTVSVATLSYYFAPVIVTAASPFLFKEKLTSRELICFIMSTVGLIMITGIGSFDGRASNALGIAFGLGAACFYATVMLLNKFIRGVDNIRRTFLQFIAAVVILAPYVFLTGGITLNSLDKTGWLCLLLVGTIHTGAAYMLYFASLRELPGQEASVLSYIDPLVAVIISVTVLGESMTFLQTLGGALILGFTLINELSPAKK